MNQPDLSEMIPFLLRAKRATYAAGIGPHASSRPGSKDLHFEEAPYLYIDTYLGDFDFIGEEAVWRDGAPIWSMNYYGWMNTDQIPAAFSACLKGALSAVPAGAPFRGPRRYESGGLVYECDWSGDVNRFFGTEHILADGAVIYELRFHGGQLICF